VALLIVQRLGLSTELIGVTLGSSAIAAVLARLPLGPAIDRYGAQRFGLSGPLFIATAAVLLGKVQGSALAWGLLIELTWAVVLIVLAVVYFLVSTILALQKISKGLAEATAGVVGIIEKSAPVADVVQPEHRRTKRVPLRARRERIEHFA